MQNQESPSTAPKELKKEVMTTVEGLNTFSSIVTLFITRILETLLALTKPNK